MSFEDLDFGEKFVGMSVREMTGNELMNYAQEMHKHLFGFAIAVEFDRDRNIMRWLKRTYRDNAGLIVKWTFYHYDGKFEGETFRPAWFNASHKWWIDQMYSEMRRALTPVKPCRPRALGLVGRKGMTDAAIAS